MIETNINILQNKFHRLLEIFINSSSFSKKAKILFPLNKAIDIFSIKELIDEINSILNINRMPITNTELAIYVSDIYKVLSKTDLPKTIYEKEIKCKFNYLTDNYNDGKKKIVNNLVEFLKAKGFYSYLDLFIIHGSYSTLDYEDNISDLDTLILINDETLLNQNKLLELQEIVFNSFEYFYEIDLLHHHGYFVLTNFDLNYYNETFFPTMLFDYSTSVYQSKESFLFNIRNYDNEKKLILDSTLSYIENTNPNTLNTLMSYKVYFQVIQLIPIAYLQYLNNNTYKKYSFDLFLKDFPQYKDFFSQIYDIRLNWKQNSIKKYRFLKLFNILKNRHILFLNSKLEKVSSKKIVQLGEVQYTTILKPMINDIRNKLEEGKMNENI